MNFTFGKQLQLSIFFYKFWSGFSIRFKQYESWVRNCLKWFSSRASTVIWLIFQYGIHWMLISTIKLIHFLLLSGHLIYRLKWFKIRRHMYLFLLTQVIDNTSNLLYQLQYCTKNTPYSMYPLQHRFYRQLLQFYKLSDTFPTRGCPVELRTHSGCLLPVIFGQNILNLYLKG